MGDTGCVCYVGTTCNTPDGKDFRDKGAHHLRMLSLVQMVTSVPCIVVGIASMGVALTNPNYPQINGYALITGILVLVGSISGLKATTNAVLEKDERRVKRHVLVNYVMNILCLTFASLQFSVTGWAIGECISTNPDAAIKCEPYTTVNVVLGIIVISLGVILFITCLIGTIFFCIYARSFGFVNHYGTMQKQIDTLRKQLDEQESNNHVKKAYEAFGSKGP
ncbi:uncharacterized protein LOC124141352 isoform X1 [Haliotis rufescens]|uniref:uncharacterized protein LOC124141352 isoform X1 n=1 Tax=Haliotis rufescens TaxID=6454 RepID=UPI00201F669F|nr:uncharacterized protein LOC124141352 isoform X1 [Haliotis rufescens]